MTYRVQLPDGVETLILKQSLHLLEEGASGAVVSDWLSRLYDLFKPLADHPRLYPKAELVSRVLRYEVRRLNHGEYAVFYRVDDDRRIVEIVDFRHGRMRPWGGP